MKVLEVKDENLRKVYEQYWLHARHQESQRLWFTNIYVVLVAGVFAYFGIIEEHYAIKILMLIFLMILSLFGYLVIYSWNLPFVIYSRLAEEISICEFSLPKKYQRFTKYGKDYEYYKYIGFGKKISIRISTGRVLFMLFYSLMIGIFGALISQTIYNVTNWQVVLIAVILFAIFYLYYHFYWEPNTVGKIQSDFESRIEKHYQKVRQNRRITGGKRNETSSKRRTF